MRPVLSGTQNAFYLVIIGGGPGGLAPLLAAHRLGQINGLMAKGVAVIEQSASLGAGSIGDYAINSDSSGATFVDCLLSDVPTELTLLKRHPLTQQLAAAGEGAVPLQLASRFLHLVGDTVGRMLREHAASEVLTSHRAVSAAKTDGGWQVEVLDLTTGERRSVFSRYVIIATGAHQPAERLAVERVGGIDLMQSCHGRLLQSGDVLTAGGLEHVASRLAGKASPRVAIIGGSTSAAAVAHALLHRLPGVPFGPGAITLLHRRELRVYYPDRASALTEGYDDWTEDDVCPISGKVFRFAGFRLDSRELIMQAHGIGGREPEPRLRLHNLASDDAVAQVLDAADLVIAAMGYRPRGLAILGRSGPIGLLAQTGPQMPMVDGQCRILDSDGVPIDGLFGIGLAMGFVPRGALGGEPSFSGQANGLWLWQHDVGSLIVNAVTAPSEHEHGWLPDWSELHPIASALPVRVPAEVD